MSYTSLRSAKKEDSLISAKLIYSTGPYFFDYLFSNRRDVIITMLTKLFEKNTGIFSHRFATIASINESAVGIELGYGWSQKEVHTLLNGFYIIARSSPLQVPRMLFRDHIINRFLKPVEGGNYYIANLAVLSGYRGKGIGEQLLENAISKAESKNFLGCCLDVSVYNLAAVNLYKKMGFKILKELKFTNLERKNNLESQYRMIKSFKKNKN